MAQSIRICLYVINTDTKSQMYSCCSPKGDGFLVNNAAALASVHCRRGSACPAADCEHMRRNKPAALAVVYLQVFIEYHY